MSDDLKPAAWLYTPTPDRPVKDTPFVQPNRAKMDTRYWAETPLYTADRITALIAAGDKLAGFADHDFGCLHYERNDSCDCGYTDAWKAWHNLTGKAEP